MVAGQSNNSTDSPSCTFNALPPLFPHITYPFAICEREPATMRINLAVIEKNAGTSTPLPHHFQRICLLPNDEWSEGLDGKNRPLHDHPEYTRQGSEVPLANNVANSSSKATPPSTTIPPSARSGLSSPEGGIRCSAIRPKARRQELSIELTDFLINSRPCPMTLPYKEISFELFFRPGCRSENDRFR